MDPPPPPGFELDAAAPSAPAAKQPATRQVGAAESAGRTIGSSASSAVRFLGAGLAGGLKVQQDRIEPVAQLADKVGAIFGLDLGATKRLRQTNESLVDQVFQRTDSTTQMMRDHYAPKPGEEMSTAGQVAGGLLSAPIEMAGGFGLQHGIERSSDVLQRGGTMNEAAKAGAVSGAANVAANLLPVKVGGSAGRLIERSVSRGLPARAAPAAGAVAGGLTGGALGAGADVAVVGAENAALPEGEQFQDLERESNPGVSGGLGAAFGALAGAKGARAARSAPRAEKRPAVDEETVRLAQKAIDYGIPLRPDMLSDSRMAKFMGDVLEKVPLGGSKAADRQRAFNRAVMDQLGADPKAEALTPDVFDAAIAKAGSEIGEISGRTSVAVDELGALPAVARRETPDVQQVIKTYLDDIQQVAEANQGMVPGEQLRKLRTEASTQARGSTNGDLRRTLGEFIDRIDDVIERHAPPEDTAALADARRRYAVAKTLEPLVAKSSEGNVSPAALMGRVTSDRAGKARMARGKGGELGDLARIGQKFLKEPPSSGTMERLAAGGTVAGIGTGALLSPATAAAATGVVGVAQAYNRLGPRLAQAKVEKLSAAKAPTETEDASAATKAPEPATEQAPRETTAPADARLAEIEKLKEGASPETVRVLDEQAKKVQRELRTAAVMKKRAEEAAALEEKAQATSDPDVRQALLARANELRPEKVPAGEARELRDIPTEPVEAVRGKLPVGEAKELPAATGLSTAGKPLPAGDARVLAPDAPELTPTKRERDLLRLREAATDAEVLKDLDRSISAERKRAADQKRGEEYLRLADEAGDEDLRTDFEAKAKKLGVTRAAAERLPVAEAVELPVDTVVAQVMLDAKEIADWRRTHKFGDLDAKTAEDVATALGYDSAATERAVQQLERSPRAFEREVQRIIEEGKGRASETEQAAGGGQGPDRPPGGKGAVAGQPRTQRDAAPGTQRGEPARAGRQGPDARADGGARDQRGTARAAEEVAGKPGAASAATVTSLRFKDLQKRIGDIPEQPKLAERERDIERRFAAAVRANPDEFLRRYEALPETKGGKIVNTDDARELWADYSRDSDSRALYARAVHEPASWIAKAQWDRLLAEPPKTGKVLLLGGGGGSGKSTSLEGVQPGFADRFDAIFDTTLSSEAKAVKSIEDALASGREVVVTFTVRDPLESIVNGIIPRAARSGRTVPLDVAAKAHEAAPAVFQHLRAAFADDPRVLIQLVDNTGGQGAARFIPTADLPAFNYNGLADRAKSAAAEAHEKGRISQAVYRGLVGDASAEVGAQKPRGLRENAEGPHHANAGGQPESQRPQVPAGRQDQEVASPAARSTAGRLPDVSALANRTPASSADFLSDFLNGLDPADRQALVADDGRLSQRGAQRMRSAILASVYGDLDDLAASTDPATRNVLAGLLRAAPELASARRGAREAIAEAARRYGEMRSTHTPLTDYLKRGGVPLEVVDMLTELDANARAPLRVADALRAWVAKNNEESL
jgi:PAS domain-containing protein